MKRTRPTYRVLLSIKCFIAVYFFVKGTSRYYCSLYPNFLIYFVLNASKLLELSLSTNVFLFISNLCVLFESFLRSLIKVIIKKRVVRKKLLVKS